MSAKQSKGFTLIEIVVGLVVIAIVTLVVTAGMGSLFRQTVDPWQQVRATEIGQSLMNEIMARRFDENSNVGNQYVRCGEYDANDEKIECTLPINLGPDNGESQRKQFDDVDDYHDLRLNGAELSGSSPNRYNGFEASVRVTYKEKDKLKRITVIVTTPQGESIEFSAIKGNW